MGHASLRRAALLAILALVFAAAAKLRAQSYVPTPQELDQLLAPVALYPDALLAQITTASTNPQEILDADDWLHQNSRLQGQALSDAAQAQGFDPAFVALVNFPQVLEMMAQNIDDYAAIGAAFEANPDEVTDSVQRLREMAYSSGALRSTPQQQVIFEDTDGGHTIEILPANSQVVYLPSYNPALIYSGVGLSPGAIAFGAGIGLGWGIGRPWGWGNWGWNWRTRAPIYNRQIWRPQYNRYRSRRSFRPRPPNYSNRPVIRPRPPNRPGRPSIQPVRPRRPTTRPAQPNRPGRPTSRAAPLNQPQARPQPRPRRPTRGVRRAPVPARLRPAPPSDHPRPAQLHPQPRPGGNSRPGANPRSRPQQQRHEPQPKQESRPKQPNNQ